MNQKTTLFFAHSTEDASKSNWQPLNQHLENVGLLSAEFAQIFQAEDWAKVIGYLHDLGKATHEFQQRLEGSSKSVNHSTWGAIKACQQYVGFGHLMAYVIAGHHAGLANGDTWGSAERFKPSSSLQERLEQEKELPKLNENFYQEIQSWFPKTLATPDFIRKPHDKKTFQLMLFARMLLSCLVDADRLDTENFYQQADNLVDSSVPRGNYPSLVQLKEVLDKHLQGLPCTTDIQLYRQKILKTVVNNACQPMGVFSLTVPTGGGKTLTSLAFALHHALHHNQQSVKIRRIIYAIPFTSIIEQNAQVFRQAFGDTFSEAVIEHHSAFNEMNFKHSAKNNYNSLTKLRQATENWQAPVIVTTTVQLIESLFSNLTSKLRKLHNIAGSIIILDEAQMLPLHLLLPCVQILKELQENYQCSIVLCTATQPALLKSNTFPEGFDKVKELAWSNHINPTKLYHDFRRVTVKDIGKQTDDEICQRLEQRKQALCIVNNRQQAQNLYSQLKQKNHDVFHLSTYMCAEHRSQTLSMVQQRLKNNQPCLLVATSLIECGVDIDMPYVLRSDAGLDSIAQAAGRCNREGKNDITRSLVEIFTPVNYEQPHELKIYANKMRETLRQPNHQRDPLSLNAIEDFFNNLYFHLDTELDKPQILKNLSSCNPKNLPFAWVSQVTKVIRNSSLTVIIPFDDKANKIIKNIQYLPKGISVNKLARQLQRYTISMPQHLAQQLLKQGELHYLQPENFGEQFLTLKSLTPCYYQDIGFNPQQNPYVLDEQDVIF